MAIKPAMWLMTLAAGNQADLDEALDSEVIRAAALNAPDAFYARHGAQHPLGIGFTGAQDILPQDIDEQTALSHIKKIPTAVVRDALLCGTPDEIADRVAEWRDCRAALCRDRQHGHVAAQSEQGVKSTVPLLQAVRRLKKL